MKLIIIILFTCLMQVSARTLAQKITLNERNAPLGSVIDKIRAQTGYDFIFNYNDVAKANKVSVSLDAENLNDALKEIFKNQELTYSIKDNFIVLKPKEPSFLDRLANRWANIDVSGRVVDAEGNGIPGATVSVNGSSKSAVTGRNGIFNLGNVPEDAILVISYIGFIKKEVKVSANLGDVILEQSLSKLDEVQVIAYGTTTQRLSTGNVTTIKADVIEKQPVNNPLLALQGRVPGLFIEQATGFAGTGVKVRIQGQNSMENGSDPLYIVDGVPYLSQSLSGGNNILGSSGTNDGSTFGSPLSFINPLDIESIDVLKDADATAIYGSRAANGAILITTKKGRIGDTKINFMLQSGLAKVPRKIDLMNTQQYLEMRKQALKNDGVENPEPGAYGDNDLNGNWSNTRNIDWQKELIGGTAGYYDFNTSLSGGTDRTTFLISGGYHRETTVFPGKFSDQKASLHFSINNISLNQKFKLQFSGGYLYDNNQLPNYDFTSMSLSLAPNAPSLYNSQGNVNWEPDENGNSTFMANPIGYIYNSFLANTKNLIGNMGLSYQIIPDLNFSSNFGYTNLVTNVLNKNFPESVPPEFLVPSASRTTVFGNSTSSSWSIEPLFTYNRTFNRSKLEILLGATIHEKDNSGSQIVAGGFANDLVMENILAATIVVGGNSIKSDYRYNALFGRINYNWDNKYIINLTGRRDGSSKFGPASQFHNFAAIGGAWIFSNEKFIHDQIPFLSYGKIRGSFGTTGSDQINDYQFLSLYTSVSQDNPYQGVSAYKPNGLFNPSLEWEETKKLQIGLDLGVFKERILLNVNYYLNHSSNQLSGYQLPWTTGFRNITRNQSFTIENSGWEFSMSSTNLQTKCLTWKSSINFTIPKTLLAKYPNQAESSDAYLNIVGKPLGVVNLLHFIGVDPATGIYQFKDKNGNPTTSPGINDYTVYLNPFPGFYGGIQNAFNYKRFQLDFLLQFVKQIGKNYSFGTDYAAGIFNSGTLNQPSSLAKLWKNPGDVTSIQKATVNSPLVSSSLSNVYVSDAAYEGASYLRLKNVALSWQLPQNWLKGAALRDCSFFIQGQNLLTITNYSGLDPETKNSTSLPPLRVITFGVKIGL